ncbi:MAG TPA: hypothetical protein DCE55_20000 [Planctomycetaceae bacterium]|nr:hypothetical protein [Planctomycetaceae bacterium]
MPRSATLRFALLCWLQLIAVPLAQNACGDPGAHWPAFRGNGNSISSAQDLPLSWDKKQNIAWAIDLPGYGQSSPVIWGTRVFVTSRLGPNQETCIAQCYDLKTGALQWSDRFDSKQTVAVSDYVSRSAPTPAADGQHFFAFFESGDLRAYQHDGTLVWQRALMEEYGSYEGNHGLGSSVAQTDEALYVLVDHSGPSYLLSIDKQTGRNRWKLDRQAKVSWSSPLIVGDKTQAQILVSSNGTVEAFQADNGEALWQVDGLEGNNVPSPTASSGIVVIGANKPGHNLALRQGSLEEPAEKRIQWRSSQVTSSFGSPLIYRDMVYFVNRAGVAFCVALKTGETRWKHRLPGSCWCSPIAAGDRLYFFSKSGETTILSADHTSQPKVLATNTYPCADRVYGVAAVHRSLVVRQATRLIHISSQTSEERTAPPEKPSK